jgi:hypothetical protein
MNPELACMVAVFSANPVTWPTISARDMAPPGRYTPPSILPPKRRHVVTYRSNIHIAYDFAMLIFARLAGRVEPRG